MKIEEVESVQPVPAPKGGRKFFKIVLGIAALLLAVVIIPTFFLPICGAKSPRVKCYMNIKQIDAAVRVWAEENGKTTTDSYSLTDPKILQYLKGSILPVCPDGGPLFAWQNGG